MARKKKIATPVAGLPVTPPAQHITPPTVEDVPIDIDIEIEIENAHEGCEIVPACPPAELGPASPAELGPAYEVAPCAPVLIMQVEAPPALIAHVEDSQVKDPHTSSSLPVNQAPPIPKPAPPAVVVKPADVRDPVCTTRKQHRSGCGCTGSMRAPI